MHVRKSLIQSLCCFAAAAGSATFGSASKLARRPALGRFQACLDSKVVREAVARAKKKKEGGKKKYESKQEVHYSVKLSRGKVTPERRSSRRCSRRVGSSVSVLFGII